VNGQLPDNDTFACKVLELAAPARRKYRIASQRRLAHSNASTRRSPDLLQTGAKAANDSHATDDSCGKAFESFVNLGMMIPLTKSPASVQTASCADDGSSGAGTKPRSRIGRSCP